MHSSLVATREGLPLGLAAIKFWNRDKFHGANALNQNQSQPLPEVLVNAKFQLRRCHSNNPLVRLSNGLSWALGDPRPGRTRDPCHACSVNV